MKKHLAILLSSIIALNPLTVSASKTSEKTQNSCSRTSANQKLKTVGIVGGTVVAAKLAWDIINEVQFNINGAVTEKHIESLFPGFKKIKNPYGDDIKRQEGSGWCWNACFQRALEKYGFFKGQKEIYKGITGKHWVSLFRSKRSGGRAPMDSRKELKEAFPFALRLFIWGAVVNDEIKSYTEKITGNKYTYQTLRIPLQRIFKFNYDSQQSSIRIFVLFECLRSMIACKQNVDIENAVLITQCPLVHTSHAITIEGTECDSFIIGEPTGGVTLSLPCDKFFSTESADHRLPYITSQTFYDGYKNYGMPISFIIEKDKEITLCEWEKMLSEAGF